MLTNTPKISNVTKGDIFQISSSPRDIKYDKRGLMHISQVFGTL